MVGALGPAAVGGGREEGLVPPQRSAAESDGNEPLRVPDLGRRGSREKDSPRRAAALGAGAGAGQAKVVRATRMVEGGMTLPAMMWLTHPVVCRRRANERTLPRGA